MILFRAKKGKKRAEEEFRRKEKRLKMGKVSSSTLH